MADLPAPFSKPMVLALLAGRKLETRRIAKAMRGATLADCTVYAGPGPGGVGRAWELPVDKLKTPFAVGDRLYVREEIEAWRSMGQGAPYVQYSADQKTTFMDWPPEWQRFKARPMHMFRRFSRMTLPVIGVRIERLHDITDAGAIAEGIERVTYEQSSWEMGVEPNPLSIYKDTYGWRDYTDHPHSVAPYHHDKPVLSYRSLWDSINGAGAWDKNPWVCVTSWSHVIHQNVDRIQP